MGGETQQHDQKLELNGAVSAGNAIPELKDRRDHGPSTRLCQLERGPLLNLDISCA